MPAIELECEPSSERQPGHVRPSQPERVDEPGEAIRVVRQTERRWWIRRRSDAGRVPGHDGELVGQPVELALPRSAAVADVPGQENEQRSLSRPLVGDPQSVDLDLTGAGRHRRQPSRLRQTDRVTGEHDLRKLLASIEPVLRPGSFVFAVVADESMLGDVAPEATVREEGLTVVLPRERADALGLTYDYVAAWITLRVHSALDAVGLTSAVSRVLAEAGLSCNVIAGYHHDHLLVPAERGHEAVRLLRDLSRTG